MVLLNTMAYDSAPGITAAARRPPPRSGIVAHGITNSDSLVGLTGAEQRVYTAG